MTPKEKAKELIDKYDNLTEECDCLEYSCVCFTMWDFKAKQCALIAVDEMIEQVKKFKFMIHHEYEIMYLNRVKQEIEKL